MDHPKDHNKLWTTGYGFGLPSNFEAGRCNILSHKIYNAQLETRVSIQHLDGQVVKGIQRHPTGCKHLVTTK